mmetsp:Transcript_17537/g.43731  ORF Transcript_17537/g.43731 Transcript_17537/m.43731 type:complete len:244 (+) Transcript_17537:2963-3694(+)
MERNSAVFSQAPDAHNGPRGHVRSCAAGGGPAQQVRAGREHVFHIRLVFPPDDPRRPVKLLAAREQKRHPGLPRDLVDQSLLVVLQLGLQSLRHLLPQFALVAAHNGAALLATRIAQLFEQIVAKLQQPGNRERGLFLALLPGRLHGHRMDAVGVLVPKRQPVRRAAVLAQVPNEHVLVQVRGTEVRVRLVWCVFALSRTARAAAAVPALRPDFFLHVLVLANLAARLLLQLHPATRSTALLL